MENPVRFIFISLSEKVYCTSPSFKVLKLTFEKFEMLFTLMNMISEETQRFKDFSGQTTFLEFLLISWEKQQFEPSFYVILEDELHSTLNFKKPGLYQKFQIRF